MRSGRSPEAVRLIAATKTVPIESIVAALEAGITDLGENRLQEAIPKLDALAHRGVTWHFIGRLQRRKIKGVVGRFAVIQSVEAVDVAEAISRRAGEAGVSQAVLLEVNLAGEASKGGVAPERVMEVLADLSRLPHLVVKGLMAIPPATSTAEEARPYFRTLRVLAEAARGRAFPGIQMDELSMGMSHDFEIAIEEGATMVRIGTAIFGARPGRLGE